jgi:hypothetical protein
MNINLLDKEIDSWTYSTLRIPQEYRHICRYLLHEGTWRCGFTVPLILQLGVRCVGSFEVRRLHTREETSVLTEQFVKLRFSEPAEYRGQTLRVYIYIYM